MPSVVTLLRVDWSTIPRRRRVLTHLQNLLLSVTGMRLCRPTALKQPRASEQGEQGQRPLPQLLGHWSSAHPEILKYGIDRPNKGIIAPKTLPKVANISVSGVLRQNYCGVACLLLRMDAQSCS